MRQPFFVKFQIKRDPQVADKAIWGSKGDLGGSKKLLVIDQTEPFPLRILVEDGYFAE